jgi:hypothetical protein
MVGRFLQTKSIRAIRYLKQLIVATEALSCRRDFFHYLRDFGNRDTLRKIWQLTSDHSNSSLGQDEFAIAVHLLEINQENYSITKTSGVLGGSSELDSLSSPRLLKGICELLVPVLLNSWIQVGYWIHWQVTMADLNRIQDLQKLRFHAWACKPSLKVDDKEPLFIDTGIPSVLVRASRNECQYHNQCYHVHLRGNGIRAKVHSSIRRFIIIATSEGRSQCMFVLATPLFGYMLMIIVQF